MTKTKKSNGDTTSNARPDFDGFIKSCRDRDATHASGERFGKEVRDYVAGLEAKLAAASLPMIDETTLAQQREAHQKVIRALDELHMAQVATAIHAGNPNDSDVATNAPPPGGMGAAPVGSSRDDMQHAGEDNVS